MERRALRPITEARIPKLNLRDSDSILDLWAEELEWLRNNPHRPMPQDLQWEFNERRFSIENALTRKIAKLGRFDTRATGDGPNLLLTSRFGDTFEVLVELSSLYGPPRVILEPHPGSFSNVGLDPEYNLTRGPGDSVREVVSWAAEILHEWKERDFGEFEPNEPDDEPPLPPMPPRFQDPIRFD